MSAYALALRVVPGKPLRLPVGTLRDAWRRGEDAFVGEAVWHVGEALRGRATNVAERDGLAEFLPLLIDDEIHHWRELFRAEDVRRYERMAG